jgi:hypothetical protein
MTQSLRKIGLEPLDNFFDSIVDERECIHYRATLNPWGSFTELYRDIDARVKIPLWGGVGDKFGNYCAVFVYNAVSNRFIRAAITKIDTRIATDVYSWPFTDEDIRSHSPTAKTHSVETPNSPHDVDDSMLIGIVYGMENPERIVVRPLESIVGLETLDNCDMFRGNPRKVSLDDFVCVAFNLVKNRKFKFETPFVIKRELTQLIDKQVKSGTGIVGEIPNDKTPLFIGQVPDPSNDAVVWRFGVSLKHKVIRLTCEEVGNRYLDSVEMLTSPAKLQSWPIKWMHSSDILSPHDEFYHEVNLFYSLSIQRKCKTPYAWCTQFSCYPLRYGDNRYLLCSEKGKTKSG